MDLLTKIQAQFSLARERGIPPYYRTTRGAATFQGSSSPPPPHSHPVTNRNIHNDKNNNRTHMTLWGGKQAQNNESNKKP